VSIWDLLCPIAIGTTLAFVYLRLVRELRSFPVRDPRLIESLTPSTDMTDSESLHRTAYLRRIFHMVGIVCLFIVFGLIVLAVIGLLRGSDYEQMRAQKRMERLQDLREETLKDLTTYAWSIRQRRCFGSRSIVRWN